MSGLHVYVANVGTFNVFIKDAALPCLLYLGVYSSLVLQQLFLELQEEANNVCLATKNALLHQQNQHMQENLESKEQMIEHLKS